MTAGVLLPCIFPVLCMQIEIDRFGKCLHAPELCGYFVLSTRSWAASPGAQLDSRLTDTASHMLHICLWVSCSHVARS